MNKTETLSQPDEDQRTRGLGAKLIEQLRHTSRTTGQEEQPKRRSNLWRLLVYVKPYWPYYAGATSCGMVKMLVPASIAWLIGQVVNTLTAANSGALNTAEAWMQLRHLFYIGLGIAIAAPTPIYFRSALAARATQEVMRNLRLDLYSHIQKLSHSFFDANRSGSLTSRIIGDVEQIQPFIGKAFVQIWMSVGMIAIVMVYFFHQSVVLGLLSVCMVPIQLLIQRKIGWRVKDNSREVRDQLAYLSGTAQEKLAAATIVKAFTGEEDEVQRFSDSTWNLVELGVANSKLGAVNDVSLNFTKMLAQMALILVGGYLAVHHQGITPGLLITFILIQGQIYTPIEWLNEMQLITATAMGATDRIFTIFDMDPEIADKPGAVKAPDFSGEVVFKDICFSYPNSSRPVFSNLNLTAPAKSTLALVGPSGGGKSTVTNLLNRFYDWDAGSIMIDGMDIRDYTIYSLRSQIGLVPQEPILFSASIEDNILYGRPDATPEEVREAARKAYATEFIEATDEGFDTMLGERGARISGGQKQRLAIARAFLKDPAIIVLDEATSALDSESEIIVQQAIEELMRDRTTIVIAHRLSTIRQADQIAVIDGGCVVELGRHDELLKHGGIYARLCKQQFEALPMAWEKYRDE